MARQLSRKGDIGFSAISVVGGLISPDKIAQIAATSPNAKTAESYACPKGTSLRDEIARYFRIGQAEWQSFSRTEAPNFEQCTTFAKALLEGAFGFQSLQKARPHHEDGHTYNITLEGKSGRIPIVVAPPATDETQDAFKVAYSQFGDAGGGRTKRRPDALLQEWLNASEPALWGLVFAGDRLRLLRDNASFTRPAYIEADLGAIFRDEMFADFTALWLLIHGTRFGNEGAPVTDCALERWREEGVESGSAARERLRENVEEALLSLGQGFLEGNPELREKLDSGTLSDQLWFEQLLRIVYRLIFTAVTEERDLLHEPDAKPVIRKLYAEGYSFAHMRERSTRRTLRDPHGDVWEGARILFRALDKGEAKLGLPALGGIFDESLTPDLNESRIANKHFLNAIYRLSFIQDEKTRVRINWRDMATEELGSVYEGLLELVPTRTNHGRDFAFAGGDEARGNARKTSGSYYTHDSLVQALLDSSLDPLLDRAEANGGAQAILDLTVIDPACGSAHFLLGAARRMAERVAKIRDSENPDFQHALRDVVRRCIYGVDRNPMAVELAKVALWIEAVEPGKPLGFLDANVRCGDSLLGVLNLEVLRHGIPDAAYKNLTGDSKTIARDLGRKNSAEREGQATFEFAGGSGSLPPPPPIGALALKLREMPEDTPRQITAKAKAFEAFEADDNLSKWRSAADIYIAAFLTPKSEDTAAELVPTSGQVWEILTGAGGKGALAKNAAFVSHEARAFHWPLEFPDIMARGGFNLAIGNPPWERIKLEEKEFFASRAPDIAAAKGKANRQKLIDALSGAEIGSPERKLYQDFLWEKRKAEAFSEFVRLSGDELGRFKRTGTGDVNTYALFAEHFSELHCKNGQAGVIVPTGIATNETTAPFFDFLVSEHKVVSLFSYSEIKAWFPGTKDNQSFCLLTLGSSEVAEFCFKIEQSSDSLDPRRRFQFSPSQVLKINPNTRTAPVFRSQADAEVTAKVYANTPVLIDENLGSSGNPWVLSFVRMFDMSNDSSLFRTASQLEANGLNRDGADWVAAGVEPKQSSLAAEGAGAGTLDLRDAAPREPKRYVPLYEAKMVTYFDNRWGYYPDGAEDDTRALPRPSLEEKEEASYDISPRVWVERGAVEQKLNEKGWSRNWMIGHRGLTNNTNERTFITSIIPRRGAGNSFPIWIVDSSIPADKIACLYSNSTSLVVDFVARNKIGGTNLNLFYLKQFPFFPPDFYNAQRRDFIKSRTIELAYTNHSMASFARDLGYQGNPFIWNEDRRSHLRAELDAFFARAYGLGRDDLRFILDPSDAKGADYPSETFRVLRDKEVREYGEYRTARLILTAWDQFERDGTFKELGLTS